MKLAGCFRLLVVALLIWSVMGGPARNAGAQLPRDRSDNAFIEALEQQQLFGVIAWHCEARYDDPNLSQAERSVYAAHWLRAQTLLALNAAPETQESAWQQLTELSARLLGETQLFDRSQLVRFQASVIGLARARLIRVQLKTGSGSQEREMGLAAVRESIERLRQLQRDLVDDAAAAPPRVTDDVTANFSRPQLQALGNDVRFQLIACLDVRSTLYPIEDTASRRDTWSEMIKQARDLQPRLPLESPLWWQIQELALRAARRLEDWSEWDSQWEAAILGKAPPEVLGDLAAARMMHDLDRNEAAVETNARQFMGLIKLRSPDALVGLSDLSDLSIATPWPLFDIARARLYLQRGREAGRQQQAEASVLKFADLMAQRHGRYWAAELTSELLAGGKLGSESVSLLLVNQAMTRGQWEEVARLIPQGIQAAIEQRQEEQALALATRAASAARASGAVEPWMIEAIEKASLTFSGNAQANQIHYYACILAANVSEQSIKASEVWNRHLQMWPQGPVADKIRVQMLAPAQIAEQQWQATLESLSAIPLDSPVHEDAVALMTAVFGDSIRQQLRVDKTQAEVQRWAADWVTRWKPQLQDEGGDWVSRWNHSMKKLALLVVEAQMETGQPTDSWTNVLLRRVETFPPDLDRLGNSRLQVIEIRLKFLQSPATFVPGTDDGETEQYETADLLWLAQSMSREIPLPGIREKMRSANDRGRGRVAAQWLLRTDRKLEGRTLTPSDRQWLDLYKVRSLMMVDRVEDARQLAKKLEQQQPSNLKVQQLLGYCLADSNDPTDATAAERHWRRLSQQTVEDSDDWFETKYYVAESLRRQGKNEDAYRVLAYLKLTHPDAWEKTQCHDSLERLHQLLAPNERN